MCSPPPESPWHVISIGSYLPPSQSRCRYKEWFVGQETVSTLEQKQFSSLERDLEVGTPPLYSTHCCKYSHIFS